MCSSPDESQLPADWAVVLGGAGRRAENRVAQLYGASDSGSIYPDRRRVFRAFHETAFEGVRVVVLGQDPYYDRIGKADGLAFSISDGPAVDSLHEIFESLAADVPGFNRPGIGDLSPWASRGVLLLNSALTVPAGTAGKHLRAWSGFTRSVLRALNERQDPTAFMLWVAKAIGRGRRLSIDRGRHRVVEAAHARRGAKWQGKAFAEFEVFKPVNEWLADQSDGSMRWDLP